MDVATSERGDVTGDKVCVMAGSCSGLSVCVLTS